MPSNAHPLVPLRTTTRPSPVSLDRMMSRVEASGVSSSVRAELADAATVSRMDRYAGNIENMVGTIKIPVGVVGPLRVNGQYAQGDYFVPLATTEAALVASYARGVKAVAQSGVETAVLFQSVPRSPAFRFGNIAEAVQFSDWVRSNLPFLTMSAEATTSHGRLQSIRSIVDGNLVFLECRYSTGDASGQNMTTFATQALCQAVLRECPHPPVSWFLEGNFSGDKKASHLGALGGRGYRVTAQADIPAAVVETVLCTGVEQILEYGRIANLGALMSGQIGAQAHYANGLAALYLATGQDVACVAESAVGITRMEESATGLLVTVTLPSLMIGTVGGGTHLPSQAAGLDMMGLRGAGHAGALAEVAAALCLCGELSLTAAVCAGHFATAHKKLARGAHHPVSKEIPA